MKNIAVIGAGISGLAAAYLLSRRHRVQLFEKEERLGGHTNTVLVATPHGSIPLDTGFLVHNDRTYPNLVRLFGELGVATRDSDMSFAVSCRRTGLEYSSRGANGFFAQRPNLVKPSHLFLLREIVRFNREAPALLDAPDADRQTLGDFLESRRFGEPFTHRYLLPMASAIWSASLDAIRSFPALTLIRFFDNHGLLSLHEQPTWKVVAGGSHTYIPTLTAPFSDGIHERAEIQDVRRSDRDVTIAFRDRPSMVFDDVVFACHGDQVLPLPALRQGDGAIVGAERVRPNQPLALEISSAPTRTIGIVAQVVQIGLGHNPKGADGPQHAALGAVDLVDTVALPNRSSFASAWKVELPREHVASIALLVPVAIAGAATATEASVPGAATIAIVVARIVPSPHSSTSRRSVSPRAPPFRAI